MGFQEFYEQSYVNNKNENSEKNLNGLPFWKDHTKENS